MRAASVPSLVRSGSALALVLVLLPLLGACTKGGQFDPTDMLNSDVFDSKKKISGQRVPVFPDGVPGTTTGVPADLVKGYQPPPDQSDADASQTPPPAGAGEAGAGQAGAAQPVPPKTASAEDQPKPKVRPKPKVASAPARSGPSANGPTRINVGAKPAAPAQGAAQDPNAASQTNWPAPPPATAQTNWPAPQTTTPAQRVQEDWPSPSATAPAQKTAQPSQSIWPNPPATTQ